MLPPDRSARLGTMGTRDAHLECISCKRFLDQGQAVDTLLSVAQNLIHGGCGLLLHVRGHMTIEVERYGHI
jgi:hypothetical protein